MAEQRKLVTALFADIVGSTSLGETHDPEVVRAALNRYFAGTEEIAARYGGAVEKFIGDALLIVFGTPRLHEDDAERAVRAGIAIRELVQKLDRELDVEMGVRIGINSGEAVVAEEPQQHFPITGDAINVAARLQQNATPGEIVVGALTERLTRAAIQYAPRDAIVAKGKSKPVPAFRAVRARSSVPVQARGLEGLRAPLVGRERESHRVGEAIERITAERVPQLFTIIGPAGVGKSRLASESLAELPKERFRVLRGRCLPYGSGIAYWPLMDLVRDDAGILQGDTAAAARAKLSERMATLASLDGDAAGVQARLAVLLGLEEASAALPSVPLERVAAELSWGIRRHMQAIAAVMPVVALIDDIQWAHEVAIETIDDLLNDPAEAPILLLCLARPEVFERHSGWSAGRPNATFLRLEPLDPGDTELLISGLLDIEELPVALRDRIVERSQGNPLFCEEFLRMLIDDGRIASVGGRWRAAGDVRDVRVPETIQTLLGARIDSLPLAEKVTLQAASVIGERLTVKQLGALLAGREGAAPEALVRRGMLVEDRREPEVAALRFRHVLIRDVAYGQLPKTDRGELHDRLARQLESEVGDREAEFSELVAHHAERAYTFAAEVHADPAALRARAARAAAWLARAGDRAFGIYATESAVGYYTRALDLAGAGATDVPTIVRLHQQRGRALELRGAYDEALANYADLDRLGRERGDDGISALGLAQQAAIFSTPTSKLDPARAQKVMAEALEKARDAADRALVARIQWMHVNLLFWNGHVEEAWTAGEDAVREARELGLEDLLALALNDLARTYLFEGSRSQEGERALVESRELFIRQGNKPMLADSFITTTFSLYWRGDLDKMGESIKRFRRITEESQNLWGIATVLSVEHLLAFERGDVGGSIRSARAGIKLAREANFLIPEFQGHEALWSAYHLLGARAAAAEELAIEDAAIAAMPAWRSTIVGVFSDSDYIRAMIAAEEGRIGEARGWLDESARARGGRFQIPRMEFAGRIAEIEIALAAREDEKAAELARSAVANFTERGLGLMLPDLELYWGLAVWRRGDHDGARTHFDNAAAIARERGQHRITWRILAALADLEDSLGRPKEAEAARAEGRGIVERIAASLDDPALEEGFRATPTVRSLFDARPGPARETLSAP
ncbi:MAG: AAA family ATPase [Chloroflexota bacterium]|nr:AAA family ATPase [Chloroflexota bacterium]